MTASTSATHGAESTVGAAAVGHLQPRLERFWPSRRPHAFDEFCRR